MNLRKSADPNALSDPDRARIQEASDRCSRETMEEPGPTVIGELTAAVTTVGLAVEVCKQASFAADKYCGSWAMMLQGHMRELSRLLATLEQEIYNAHHAAEMAK